MDTNIRRVEAEAGIQKEAVRRVGARRHRDPSSEQEFDQELARQEGQPGKSPTETNHESASGDTDRSVSPPEEDEAGGRINLIG